jgi:hypothetical protein
MIQYYQEVNIKLIKGVASIMQKETFKTLSDYQTNLNRLRFAESYDKIIILGCSAGKTFSISYLEV